MFVRNGIKYNTAKEVSELLGVHYKSVPRLAFSAVGYFKIKAQTFIVEKHKCIGYTDEDIELMKKIYHPTEKTVERQKEKEVMKEKNLELKKSLKREYKKKKKEISVKNLIIDLLKKDRSKGYTIDEMKRMFKLDKSVIELNIYYLLKDTLIFEMRAKNEVRYYWDE